jgi:DNA repair protein RadC
MRSSSGPIIDLRRPSFKEGLFCRFQATPDSRQEGRILSQNCVIRVITVAVGSLNASLVHPREVMKPAIRAFAAGILIVHNHPTGDPEPSAEDVELTRRFVKCCELIGIDFVDHVIIGDGAFKSLKNSGLI